MQAALLCILSLVFGATAASVWAECPEPQIKNIAVSPAVLNFNRAGAIATVHTNILYEEIIERDVVLYANSLLIAVSNIHEDNLGNVYLTADYVDMLSSCGSVAEDCLIILEVAGVVDAEYCTIIYGEYDVRIK